MLIRGQTTQDRIAEIANSFAEGLKGYSAGQQRFNNAQTEENRYQDKINLAKTELEQKKEERKRALGIEAEQKEVRAVDLEKKRYDLGQTLLPLEQRDSYKQAIAMAGTRAGSQENQFQARVQQEKKSKIDQVKIQDFDLADPEVIPTQKDAESVKSLNVATKNFERLGTEINDLIGGMEKQDYFGVTQRARLLKQKIGEAQLAQKEIKKLGVLNGPDLPLVDATLGQVGSLSTLALLGPANAQARMNEAIKNSKNNLNSESSARGYKAKQASPAPQGEVDPLRAELEQRRALKAQSMAGG